MGLVMAIEETESSIMKFYWYLLPAAAHSIPLCRR
jgi:hypothetical protein